MLASRGVEFGDLPLTFQKTPTTSSTIVLPVTTYLWAISTSIEVVIAFVRFYLVNIFFNFESITILIDLTMNRLMSALNPLTKFTSIKTKEILKISLSVLCETLLLCDLLLTARCLSVRPSEILGVLQNCRAPITRYCPSNLHAGNDVIRYFRSPENRLRASIFCHR